MQIELTDMKTKKVVDTLEVDACMVATGRCETTMTCVQACMGTHMLVFIMVHHAKRPSLTDLRHASMHTHIPPLLPTPLAQGPLHQRPEPGRHWRGDRQARLRARVREDGGGAPG